ncbi:hypothetical protein ACFLVN_01515 [Chloroflexota bacterium]
MQSLPGFTDGGKITELIPSMERLIAYTLEKTTKLKCTRGSIEPPLLYTIFSDLINRLISSNKDCTIITFNYDLGLDYSLYRSGIVPDYGLNDNVITGKNVKYLKLHGSLNWGKCSKCEKIVPYRNFQYTEHKSGLDYATIPVISKLQSMSCCEEQLNSGSLIVPPTWNKTAFHGQINQVWRKAASELKDTENIFVLGYSLPNTDMFFHYLFALGVEMKTILKNFYVYNPDRSVEERFKTLLGSGVTERFHFESYDFGNALTAVNGLVDDIISFG